jgi:hypothetical protein
MTNSYGLNKICAFRGWTAPDLGGMGGIHRAVHRLSTGGVDSALAPLGPGGNVADERPESTVNVWGGVREPRSEAPCRIDRSATPREDR